MTARDPFAVGSLLERLRNIGESDLQRAGQFGGRLVSELADRAMLIGCVLLVTEDLGGGGTGHRHHQDDDPCAPAKATTCKARVRASSLDHPFHASRDRPRAARAAAGFRRIQNAPLSFRIQAGGLVRRLGQRVATLGRTPPEVGRGSTVVTHA